MELLTYLLSERPQLKRFHPGDILLAPPDARVAGGPHDVAAQVVFVGSGGQALTVPVFFDPTRGYVVRFAPPCEGVWRYQVSARDAALDGLSGALDALPNDHPRLHGLLQVDREHPHHFVYEDGTRCFLFGYEANWLMMVDQQPSDLTRVDALLDSIQGVGFNMVTVNAFAYTCRGWLTAEQEHDRRYITPALAPWVGGNDHPDYACFDEAYFRHYDRVMLDLLGRGILAHIMVHVYNKQCNWPALGCADDERFWRYFVARYQAFANVIWDTAKESYYQPAPYIWQRLATLRANDGYRHLVTVHDANTPPPRPEKPNRFHDPTKELSDALADFKADQIHQDWYADAVRNYAAAQRPYVNIEYGYEQGVNDLPTYRVKQDWREVLRRTWLVTMGGAYANYYYSNTAWNLFLPLPEPPGYAPHRFYAAFWQGTRYWLLAPDNAPLGESFREGVYCRCCAGQEYVVLDFTGEGFTLRLPPAGTPYRAVWLNIVTGESRPGEMCAGGEHAFRSPWGAGTWAVLHARSEG